MSTTAAAISIRIRAWLPALLICVAWVLLLRPWTRDGVSPATVAIVSLIATLALRAVRQRYGSVAAADSTKLYDDVAFAFFIMTVTGALFTIFGATVAKAPDPASTLAVIHQVQRGAYRLAEAKSVLFWIAVATAAVGTLLLVSGRIRPFERLMGGYKPFKTWSRRALLASICVGSFSLAGTVSAASIEQRNGSVAYELNVAAQADLAKLEAAVRHRIAEEIAQQVVATDQSVGETCRNIASDACPDDPVAELAREVGVARDLQSRWPLRPTVHGLPAAVLDIGDLRAAVAFNDAIGTLQNRSARPAASGTAPDNATPSAARQAVAAVSPEAPPQAPAPDGDADARKRLDQVFEVAISAALEGMGLSLTPKAVSAGLGAFAGKTAGAVSGKVQSELEKLTRKVAIDILLACRGGSAKCFEAGAVRLRAMKADPAIGAAVAAVARATNVIVDGYRALAIRAHRQNGITAAQYTAAVDRVVAREREGAWGALRQRWIEDLSAGRVEDLTSAQKEGWTSFANEWRELRRQKAVDLVHEGRAGTPAEWNQAFLAHLRESPRSAAIFGYWALNDPVIRPVLMQDHPASVGRVNNVADVYAMFVGSVEGWAWTSRRTSAELFEVGYGDFADAVGEYCPHAS